MTGFGGLNSLNIMAYMGIYDTNFSSTLNDANTKAERTSQTINKVMNVALKAGAAAFTTAVIAAGRFEQQMAMVDTLLGTSTTAIDGLKKGVLDLATKAPDSIGSLTKGLYDLISSGATASNAINSLALATQAATAGMTTTDVAIQSGMATVNAYALSMDDLTRIYDLQFQAVNVGVMTFEQMSGAIGNVLPAAASLGVSLEDVYGAMAHVTKAGIDAQSATTYLARAFISMGENTDKWKTLGIEVYDVEGKFRGLQPIIGELAKKIGGLSDEARKNELAHLGMEDRAGRAILAMTNNYAGFVQTMNTVSDSTGAMKTAFDKTFGTFENQAKIFKNVVQTSFIQVGNQLLPVLTAILRLFNDFPGVTQPVIKTLAELAITVGSLIAVFKVYNMSAKIIPGLNALSAASFGPIGIAITAAIGLFLGLKNAIDSIKQSQLDAIGVISDQVANVEKLAKQYYDLYTSKELTGAKEKEFNQITKELTQGMKELGYEVTGNEQQLDKLASVMREKKISDLWEEFAKANDDAKVAIKAELDQLKNLPPLLFETEQAIKPTITATKELEDSDKLLKDAGIELTKTVKDQIATLISLKPQIEDDAYATKQWTSDLADLYLKIGDTEGWKKLIDFTGK